MSPDSAKGSFATWRTCSTRTPFEGSRTGRHAQPAQPITVSQRGSLSLPPNSAEAVPRWRRLLHVPPATPAAAPWVGLAHTFAPSPG
jgi:hypothetical protein